MTLSRYATLYSFYFRENIYLFYHFNKDNFEIQNSMQDQDVQEEFVPKSKREND